MVSSWSHPTTQKNNSSFCCTDATYELIIKEDVENFVKTVETSNVNIGVTLNDAGTYGETIQKHIMYVEANIHIPTAIVILWSY